MGFSALQHENWSVSLFFHYTCLRFCTVATDRQLKFHSSASMERSKSQDGGCNHTIKPYPFYICINIPCPYKGPWLSLCCYDCLLLGFDPSLVDDPVSSATRIECFRTFSRPSEEELYVICWLQLH